MKKVKKKKVNLLSKAEKLRRLFEAFEQLGRIVVGGGGGGGFYV